MEIVDQAGLVIASHDAAREGMAVAVPVLAPDVQDAFVWESAQWLPIRFQKDVVIAYVRSARIDSETRTAMFMLAESVQWLLKDAEGGKLTREEALRRLLRGDYDKQEAAALMSWEHAPYCIILFQTSDAAAATLEPMLRELFPEGVCVLAVSSNEVIAMHPVEQTGISEELGQTLEAVIDTMRTEFSVELYVGVSLPAKEPHLLRRSLQEARQAITLGMRSAMDVRVFHYKDMLLERFLQQASRESIEQLYHMYFKADTREIFNEEMLLTVERFFENNLNLSETARQLFIHRNTLVYRLDKILKMTGLDLREFNDAVLCKILMLLAHELYPR